MHSWHSFWLFPLIALRMLCTLGTAAAAARPPDLADTALRVSVNSNWALPYGQFQDGELVRGIEFDIAHAVARRLQRKVHFVTFPVRRLNQAVQSGEVDLRCHISPAWTDFPERYVWSPALFMLTDVLIGRAGLPAPDSLDSLPDQARVSTVLGYRYRELDAVFASGRLQRDDTVGTENVLRKLTAGRTPYGVTDRLVLDWYRRHTPGHGLADWQLENSQTAYRCGSPVNSRVPAAALMRALDQLKSSGELERILARYR